MILDPGYFVISCRRSDIAITDLKGDEVLRLLDKNQLNNMWKE